MGGYDAFRVVGVVIRGVGGQAATVAILHLIRMGHSLYKGGAFPPILPQNSTLVRNNDGSDYREIGIVESETDYEQTSIHENRENSEEYYVRKPKGGTRVGAAVRRVMDKNDQGFGSQECSEGYE